MSRKTVLAIVCVSLLAAVGCAKPPQEEIDQARTTLQAAQSSDAAEWAAEEWGAAQEAMQAVDAELEKQQAKFAIARSYKETERLLADASAKAAEAESAAAANKEAARVAAEGDLEAARTALASAQTLVTELQACPRKPKGFAADMEAMTGSLATLEASLAPLEASMQAEDYASVSTEAQALLMQLETLSADMQAAKQKMGC